SSQRLRLVSSDDGLQYRPPAVRARRGLVKLNVNGADVEVNDRFARARCCGCCGTCRAYAGRSTAAGSATARRAPCWFSMTWAPTPLQRHGDGSRPSLTTARSPTNPSVAPGAAPDELPE